jgi:histidyl-tRNA synthetase
MESLGGPATPAVGWAAGIERLAMLIADSMQPGLEIAIAAENPEREMEAESLAAAYRRAGFITEAFCNGSPRKRFDRARKAEPAVLISLDIRDGIPTHSVKPMLKDYAKHAEVHDLFESFGQLRR